MRFRWLVLLLAAVAAGCGTLVPSGGALVSDLVGPWNARPFDVANSLRRELDRGCKSQPGMELGEDYPVVLVHARGGSWADVAYSDGRNVIVCAVTVAPDGRVESETGGFDAADALPAAPGSITVLTTARSHDPPERTSVVGVVDASIPRVRVVRANGEMIEAAVGGGVFAVWWPAADDAVTVQGLDAAGAVVAETEA